MKPHTPFVLALSAVLLAVLPECAHGDSLMHVGIGRGMRTGTTPEIDIGRGPDLGYRHRRWGGCCCDRGIGESLMHVGIGRGMRSGKTPEIDIGRAPYLWSRHRYTWPYHYYHGPRPAHPIVRVSVREVVLTEPSTGFYATPSIRMRARCSACGR